MLDFSNERSMNSLLIKNMLCHNTSGYDKGGGGQGVLSPPDFDFNVHVHMYEYYFMPTFAL